MALKAIIFYFTVATFSTAYSAENMCDKMISAGGFSTKEIDECLKEYGESDTYKANKEKMSLKRAEDKAKEEKVSAAEAAAAAKRAAIEKNIEVKEFSKEDLDKKSIKKGFFAFKVDYSNPRKPKDVVLTSGDALCSFLGYEKSLGGEYSKETDPRDPVTNGFIIPKKFLIGAAKVPSVYPNRDDTRGQAYMTKKFVSIKCGKIISDEVEGTLERFEEMSGKLVEAGHAPKDGDDEDKVDDSGRKSSNKPSRNDSRDNKKDQKDAGK